MNLDELYIYVSPAHPDLVGAVGYLRPQRPGFTHREFVSFNTVVMVDISADVRKLNWSDRVVV